VVREGRCQAKGDVDATFLLGVLYAVAQDYAKAREWYEEAARLVKDRAIVAQAAAEALAVSTSARMPDADAELPIGEAVRTGRYDEAEDRWRN